MELDRYYELRALLQQWRARLAESIRRRIEASRWQGRLLGMYEAEGTDEAFTLWLDRWCRQAAIQFILRVLFLRVLEDRELLGATRIRTSDGQQMWAELTRNLGPASYIQWCCWDAAHLLPDLFGPTEYDLVLPDDDLVQAFLDNVWRRPDPDRPGWLRFDFRPDPPPSSPSSLPSPRGRGAGGEGDPGFQTRFIGDLYQELDAEIRERYALLQTPHFISQFILEHTLLKRFEEVDFHEVTLIDPTCGSGHFLVDAFWLLVERYEAEALPGSETTARRGRGARAYPAGPAAGHALPSARRARIARTIIERHLHGCDINPYAAALARFRLILAACDYAQPTSLADFRDLHFNIVTIDSLIPYESMLVGGVQAGSATARLLGQTEAIEKALPVLRKRYDVVVGNPPYITAQDDRKRDLYRENYQSAYRSFGLSAPFTERFLKLAASEGNVGLIVSNAFAQRQFGKRLIEEVLPSYDLETVIDLSGAYIPGHGTPTLIMLAKNRTPIRNQLLIVSNLKGEPGIPTKPSEGKVWRAVLEGMSHGSGYTNDFVDVAFYPRSSLMTHPWTFGGPKTRLMNRIQSLSERNMAVITSANGRDIHTGLNDVYFASLDFFRRQGISHEYLIPIVTGGNVRDWQISVTDYAFFPYTVQKKLQVAIFEEKTAASKYLSKFKTALEARKNYGQTVSTSNMVWYEYTYTATRDWTEQVAITNPVIATHNHFAVSAFSWIGNQHAPRISLLNDQTEDLENNYLITTSILNSSTVCFFLKQICFNKGTGDDPVRDRYEQGSTNIGQIPLPKEFIRHSSNCHKMLLYVSEMVDLVEQLYTLSAAKIFDKKGEGYFSWTSAAKGYTAPHSNLSSFTTARELRIVRDQLVALRQDIRGRMIFLQEEMDWLAYEMYGLLKGKAPLAEDYLSHRNYEAARLELGQRPFELAGKGYKGDWPAGYEPSSLPDTLRPLAGERMGVIRANPDIALLEDPLYKRRWVPPDYEQEFREAAGWWLAEKLEFALERHGQPISLRDWCQERVYKSLKQRI